MIYLAIAASNARVRGCTVFTPQEDLQGFSRKAGKGERILIVPPQSYGNLNVLQAYATQQTGLTPANDRFIAVDQKTHAITAVFIGDVLGCGDGYAGCDHYAHAEADLSWTFDPVQSTVLAPTKTVQEIAQIQAAKQARGIIWTYTPPVPQPVAKVTATAQVGV